METTNTTDALTQFRARADRLLVGTLGFHLLVCLIVCALAPSYDFFMYYFTLFITPMLLVSGVFFPADQLPAIVHAVASWLPLSHAVGLARPLLLGQIPENALMHVSALLAIAFVAFYIASALTRRRLLK